VEYIGLAEDSAPSQLIGSFIAIITADYFANVL